MNEKWKKILWKTIKIVVVLLVIAFFLIMSIPQPTVKPVIYLYPEQEMEATVEILYRGELTVLYPAGDLQRDQMCEDGQRDVVSWRVTAQPDGTLTDHADGKEYSYLFWEGNPDGVAYDFSQGYCVAGKDTMAFLQEILPQMGMTPREYNEFIVYWLPHLQDHAYNIISFQTDIYTDLARLHVDPQPDSVLRVFMAVKSSPVYVEMEPQQFETFVRDGFTVVEWGGTRVK